MRWAGFTLVELIVVMVVMGLVSLAMLIPIRMSLQGNVNIDRLTKAVNLAEERMDMILVRKHTYGFSGTTDPCPGPDICTIPASYTGYTVASSIANNWQGNASYKEITVTVSGEGDAVIKTLVGNY